MPLPQPRCPDCDVPMERGLPLTSAFVPSLDVAQDLAWFPGAPEPGGMGVKAQWEKRFPIIAYRCPRCGLLRLHAHPRSFT